jgi:hypothetical protein
VSIPEHIDSVKKRHILVDTQGLLMHAIVHAADIQDRDGGVLVMATLFGLGLYPFQPDCHLRLGIAGLRPARTAIGTGHHIPVPQFALVKHRIGELRPVIRQVRESGRAIEPALSHA